MIVQREKRNKRQKHYDSITTNKNYKERNNHDLLQNKGKRQTKTTAVRHSKQFL